MIFSTDLVRKAKSNKGQFIFPRDLRKTKIHAAKVADNSQLNYKELQFLYCTKKVQPLNSTSCQNLPKNSASLARGFCNQKCKSNVKIILICKSALSSTIFHSHQFVAFSMMPADFKNDTLWRFSGALYSVFFVFKKLLFQRIFYERRIQKKKCYFNNFSNASCGL